MAAEANPNKHEPHAKRTIMLPLKVALSRALRVRCLHEKIRRHDAKASDTKRYCMRIHVRPLAPTYVTAIVMITPNTRRYHRFR